jgi:hypothetical protein
VEEKKGEKKDPLLTEEMTNESPVVEETSPMSISNTLSTNPSEILDKEEKEMPIEQSEENPMSLETPMEQNEEIPMSIATNISDATPLKTYIRTKKCPPGCIKKTRCKGKRRVSGGKRSKKSKKNTSKKHKKSKKAKKSKK